MAGTNWRRKLKDIKKKNHNEIGILNTDLHVIDPTDYLCSYTLFIFLYQAISMARRRSKARVSEEEEDGPSTREKSLYEVPKNLFLLFLLLDYLLKIVIGAICFG